MLALAEHPFMWVHFRETFLHVCAPAKRHLTVLTSKENKTTAKHRIQDVHRSRREGNEKTERFSLSTDISKGAVRNNKSWHNIFIYY